MPENGGLNVDSVGKETYFVKDNFVIAVYMIISNNNRNLLSIFEIINFLF